VNLADTRGESLVLGKRKQQKKFLKFKIFKKCCTIKASPRTKSKTYQKLLPGHLINQEIKAPNYATCEGKAKIKV